MSKNYLSFREMVMYRGTQQSNSFNIRKILGFHKANLRLKQKKFYLSIITYNSALITISYKGTDRSAALDEFIRRIINANTDIICLCEVFDDDERDAIRSQLSYLYPYFEEGPDEDDFDEDGGLLILSKLPILDHHHSIYRQSVFPDSMANKGIIHFRVHPSASPTACDIFFTHTQNPEEDGGIESLYAQLTHINHFVRAYSDAHTPTIILGDLNISAEKIEHYDELTSRLGKPVDLWSIKYPLERGYTITIDNNFYEDSDDAPTINSRIDYILLKSGSLFIPILEDIEILKWSYASRQVSDHFGILAQFNQLMAVQLYMEGNISRISAEIAGFLCIETTKGLGSDEVSFSIKLIDHHGHFAESSTAIVEDVDSGCFYEAKSIPAAALDNDPGDYIKIEIEGKEYDITGENSLGITSITISRTDLLINFGDSISKAMPFHLGEKGEYCVEIKIIVE